MNRIKKFINDLRALYNKILLEESIDTDTVDFFLEEIQEQSKKNRKKLADLGFWTEAE